MKAMTIAGLAREGGVGVETIRYYQRRGLIGVPERSGGVGLGGGIRRYDDGDRRRLRFIRSAQGAGFTLDQISELLELDATEDRGRARALAEDQLRVLDERIAELSTARDGLRRLARECGSGSSGPCPIIEAFDEPAAELRVSSASGPRGAGRRRTR